jgi:hypothetical protein
MNPEQPIPFDVVMEVVNAHTILNIRAAHVAALAGLKCHEVFYNDGETITVESKDASMMFTWDEFKGYDSEPEPHCEYLPLRYLWTPDSEIIAEVAEQKRAREQEERAVEIESLERRIQDMRNVCAKLADAELKLAKLKEQA